MGDDVPEALDRAPVRRTLSERNMRTPFVVIGGEFRKDPFGQTINVCRADSPASTCKGASNQAGL
jgi:hypothetical protein